jgi:hypothetical protein
MHLKTLLASPSKYNLAGILISRLKFKPFATLEPAAYDTILGAMAAQPHNWCHFISANQTQHIRQIACPKPLK